MEHSFNLIDESWLRVLTNDCRLKEISLKDAFINAHNIADLSGETRAQDVALLRLLAAVMYTVFSRYGLNGEDIDLLEDTEIPLNQWEDMWRQGYIPSAPIERYFAEWHDRFWLFDEQYPFYQSNIAAEKGAYFSTAKMIGTLFESDNKKRLFSARSDQGRELSYSEAARWLIHLDCFDDRAAKYNNAAEGLKMQVPASAWVSRLGLIALKGKNLFETILLNFRADYDVVKSVYKETPSWEQDNQNPKFNRAISAPNNQSALLSLMSRRICLKREENIVTGYYVYGGDFIGSKSVENGKAKNLEEREIFDEQMTLWSAYQEEKDKKAKNDVYHFRPKLLDSSMSIWREFGSIAGMDIEIGNDKSKRPGKKPGVISWLGELYEHNVLERSYMANVVTASVIYNEGQQTSLPVIDTVSNSMNFHAQLLSDAGEKWRARIIIEIKNCESAAYYIGRLYKELQFAVGRQDKDAKTEQSGEAEAKMRFYAAIDKPFRDWLEGLTIEQDYDSSVALIERTIRDIAVEFGRALARQSGNRAVFGRASNTKREKESEKMSSAKSLSTYYAVIRKIFKLGESNDEDKQSGSDL